MKYITTTLLLCLSLLLGGCVADILKPREDPTQFYILRAHTLNSIVKAESSDKPSSAYKNVDAAVGTQVNLYPFSLPSYLGRHQIVSLEDGRMSISEFNRWAELPVAGFNRVVVDNIMEIAPNIDIYNYPAVSASENAFALRLFVDDFLGTLDGDVVLKGRWVVSNAGAKKTLDKRFNIKVKCEDSYDSYVSAMNTAIFRLSGQIAEGIAELSKTK